MDNLAVILNSILQKLFSFVWDVMGPGFALVVGAVIIFALLAIILL